MRVPKLHRHANGHFFVHWGGKRRYLGSDEHEARVQYTEQIALWTDWRAERERITDERRRRQNLKVVEVVEQFCKSKRQEAGDDAEQYYRKHLSRMLVAWGDLDADLLMPKHLQSLKLRMIEQRYSPKTVNHDIGAIKTCWRWASALDLVPPMDLGGVKAMPVGPVQDVSVSLAEVRRVFGGCDARLAPWFAVNYLALLRPSEVVRVVQGEGHFVDEGVFVLDRGKMDKRASIKRHCLLSPAALDWLGKARPHWSRLDSYSQVFRDQCPWGPKVLQKSAASHLVQRRGVDPADVELLLGHVSGRLKVTYYQPAWQRLRKLAARLTL